MNLEVKPLIISMLLLATLLANCGERALAHDFMT